MATLIELPNLKQERWGCSLRCLNGCRHYNGSIGTPGRQGCSEEMGREKVLKTISYKDDEVTKDVCSGKTSLKDR